MLRIALYARFSSENQRDASIEDQLRQCRERAEREGWTVVETYSDRAISGSSMIRAGIQNLLADAQMGRFDMVLSEALDRISRDQEDVAAVFKRLRFAGIPIPSAVRGRYPLAGVVRGYLAFLKDSIERRAEDNVGAGLASAKEREIRLRLAQREAALIDATDAESFHSFSSRLYRDELAKVGKSVSRDPIIANLIDQQLASALDRFDSRFAEAFPKLKRGIDPLAAGSDG